MKTFTLHVTAIVFTPAPPLDVMLGLLGWVRFDINDEIEIDGVAVRRTRDDRIRLSFPSRRDRDGTRHYFVRPLSDAARMAIEREVLEQLRAQRRLAS